MAVFSPYNPDQFLSDHFTLGDLIKTSQGTPNFPDPPAYARLKNLAGVLETLYTQIGPFDIASAYRSPETNAAVGGSTTSAHLQGDAADIIPSTMSIEAYFVAIYTNDALRNLLGEITFKETQGALHLTTVLESPPYQTAKQGYAEILEGGSYRGMSQSEIDALVNPSPSNPAPTDLGVADTTNPMTPKLIFAAITLIAIVVLVYKARQGRRRLA